MSQSRRGKPLAVTNDGLDLWRTLAFSGPKATAEALTESDLKRMHVRGPLDAFMLELVERGASIVLTGNAGDGKTHALRIAAGELRQAGAIVVEDATARMRGGSAEPVLREWQNAVEQKKPFCIAINEYPLYQLRRAGRDFAPLKETWRQCQNRLAYQRDDSVPTTSDVVVVDLSLRNPLAPDFFLAVLDAILNDSDFKKAIAADKWSAPAANAEKLQDPKVRERLSEILSRALALGARATVREVWILVARMVMGTGSVDDYTRADWYFEALFESSVLAESASLKRAVDPAACSHPRWDSVLEAGSAELDAGWHFSRPPVPPQPRLDASVFSWLKRAFYFEHEKGPGALELSDPEALEFRSLLSGTHAGRQQVASIVDAINAAYCPANFSGREYSLYLWSGHRFHEQPSRSFIATQRIPVDSLSLESPRLPPVVEKAFRFHPNHLMLIAPGRTDARLKIDYPLFRTLKRLGRGLPRKLMPERELHRLDAFLEKLSSARAPSTTIWSVHLEHMQVLEIGLTPDRQRYETVRVDV